MKMRLSAVLLVSTLMLASFSSVALGQEAVEDTDVQFVDCSQVQNIFVSQGQYGDVNITANDRSEAVVEIAQELNISQNQVNACLGNVGGDDGDTPPGEEDTPASEEEETPPAEEEEPEGSKEVIDETMTSGKLPETGGPSLAAVLAGTVLVAGGVALIRAGRDR